MRSDLLVLDADIRALDAFVRERGEIDAKRQTHKRAFTAAGTTVPGATVQATAGLPLLPAIVTVLRPMHEVEVKVDKRRRPRPTSTDCDLSRSQ